MMQVNFHRPTTSNAWVGSAGTYTALEIGDAANNRATIFVGENDAEFLRNVIADAEKLLAVLEAK